jgi:lipopolysaccharide transport system permease protein
MALFKNTSNGHHTTSVISNDSVTIITPASGWRLIDFKELREYRDLFFFLVWREIKVLYAQTILGLSWAILQPLIQIIIFTIVFGKVAKVQTDGTPYILFTTISILPWTYISQAMTQSSQSLLMGHAMLDKIYFPRLLFPITPVLARLVDFFISMIILFVVMVYYQVVPTWNILLLPIFFCMMIAVPTGIGMWLSALSIRFRDVKHAMPFVVRMLIYSAPIVYSASSIPERYRIIYSLNPIVGVIEGFRACLLNTPMPWQYIWPGIITSILLLFTGALYFRRMERIFVDVI